MNTNMTTERDQDKELGSVQSQMNAHAAGKLNSSKLIDAIRIEGTPFTIVTNNTMPEEENSCITVGQERITMNMSKEEAEKMIEEKEWKIIEGLVSVMAKWIGEKVKEEIKNEEEESMNKAKEF